MKCPVCGHESDGKFRSRALKCIAKKVQLPKHMQKKTICHMR